MNMQEKIDNLSENQLVNLAAKLNQQNIDEVSLSAKKLVAYIVADQLLPPTTEELREKVAKSLPAYMVPQDIIFVEDIPLSPNGKVDLSALQLISNNEQNISSLYLLSSYLVCWSDPITSIMNVPFVVSISSAFKGHLLICNKYIVIKDVRFLGTILRVKLLVSICSKPLS